MPKIRLTQGFYALVDESNVPMLEKNSWCISNTGYAKRGTKSKGKTTIHYMHRVITGASEGEYVDHLNGNRLDNRRSNLRVCTQSENGLNRNSLNINNSTGVTGVYLDKRRSKYAAEIMIDRKKVYLGRFDTLKEAELARLSYKKEHGII